MSAGSPRRSHSQTRPIPPGSTVSPQPVTDPTILDSVAGFINEVATYNVPCDTKDQIQWARFEQLDSDVVLENAEGEKVVPLALILILGYSTGIQVWAIPANGEAVEILSWRHGSVRVLRFLPAPDSIGRTSHVDPFSAKRPLIALCDSSGSQFCTLNFISLKTGEQQKVIKFKNPILDVLANRRSVVVTFLERIAVFDAFTLEDRLTVTTCYLSPGVNANPVALGTRWIAYAEKRLIANRRSGGGNEGEGVQSYTATVLHAAKSLGKGLRELGETVASSLTGNPTFKPGSSPGSSHQMQGPPFDGIQKGIVTVLDIEHPDTDEKTAQEEEGVVAHFAAHSDAIVYLAFDPSGMLLLTADKHGHDFHLFRIQPHPAGSALAAIHHIYVLHRGDTTARVQDICFSPDSRWAAVSTLRGTTHVFPITPYGGQVGVRTHATAHVVNRMSRFHRSAGLPAAGRCNSPVSLFEAPASSHLPFNNPRTPPYPHPTVVQALAQIRQPLYVQAGPSHARTHHTGRQRLNSGSSEDGAQVALRVSACFAPARAWLDVTAQAHDVAHAKHHHQVRAVESLFIMSCYGNLVQYDLEPHHAATVPKEKVCDETPVELGVRAHAQWALQRAPQTVDVPLPMGERVLALLPHSLPLFRDRRRDASEDRWLSQVEIVTHAGPHRRLWMGPQFTFKTYTVGSGSMSDVQAVDVGRSKPVNMPINTTYPILIESSSVSSCEQSPKLMEGFHRYSTEIASDGAGESQLKEDLADAMMESPGVRETGGRCVIVSMKSTSPSVGVAKVAKVVNPLGTVVTVPSDDDPDPEPPMEEVIHANCDEALFRPIVTPKPARKLVTMDECKKPIVDVSQKKASKKKTEREQAVCKEEAKPLLNTKSGEQIEEVTVKLPSKGKTKGTTRAKFEAKCEINVKAQAQQINVDDVHVVQENAKEKKMDVDAVAKSKRTSLKIELEPKLDNVEDPLPEKEISIKSTDIIPCKLQATIKDPLNAHEELPDPIVIKLPSKRKCNKKIVEIQKTIIDPEETIAHAHTTAIAIDLIDEAFVEDTKHDFPDRDMIQFEDAENFWLIEEPDVAVNELPIDKDAGVQMADCHAETIFEEWEMRDIVAEVRAICARVKRTPSLEEMCAIVREVRSKRDAHASCNDIQMAITALVQRCQPHGTTVSETDVIDALIKSERALKIEEAAASSEDDRPTVKVRKSKTKPKLGAKVNWGKEEKELYWKSVFPTDAAKEEIDAAPKMSYSSAAKRQIAKDEQIFAETSSSDDNTPPKEEKLNEEKEGNSSSPVETTESDEDKGIGLDPEDQRTMIKTTDSLTSKSKKKPKKKKR